MYDIKHKLDNKLILKRLKNGLDIYFRVKYIELYATACRYIIIICVTYRNINWNSINKN